MPLNASAMTNEIVSKLPTEWQVNWIDGQPPKEWMLALCTDTVAMWSAVTLLPGTAAVHVHGIAVPVPAVTTAMVALGYTGPLANAYFGGTASAVSSHINSQLAMNAVLGATSHDHAILVPPTPTFAPFTATSSTLETSLLTNANAANVFGAPMPDQGNRNSLEILFEAFAKGFLEHVEANAGLTLAVDTGTGHSHAIV